MRVTQLINANGNAVANHFVILKGTSHYLQSYNSIVAKIDNLTNAVTFGSDWDYSATTLKHLKTFLETRETKKQLQQQVDSGAITLDVNLAV